MFADNPDVVFADINLRESPTTRVPELGPPGKGGWPTIRYFNKATGNHGAAYQKVTDLSMCKELGDRMRMIDYVEDSASTVLCGVDGTNCNEKELTYLDKWKVKTVEEQQDQLDRLTEMSSETLKPDLQEWIWRRMRILKRLTDSMPDHAAEEL